MVEVRYAQSRGDILIERRRKGRLVEMREALDRMTGSGRDKLPHEVNTYRSTEE